jgi:hypothetical protein
VLFVRASVAAAKGDPERSRSHCPKVDYERNSEGWGGTIARIDAAEAALTHIENLMSFYVTRVYDNDPSFELQKWYMAWRKAAKRDN